MVDNPLLGNNEHADEPWALEETQSGVLKALNTQLKGQRSHTRGVNQTVKNLETLIQQRKIQTSHQKTANSIASDLKKQSKQNVKNTGKYTNELLSESKRQDKRFHDMSDSVAKSLLTSNGQGLGNLTNGIANIANDFDGNLSSMSRKLGEMIGWVPIFGASLGALVGILGNTVDRYREFVNIGHTFNGSMLEMMQTSASAGLSLKQLAEVTNKYSSTINKMGVASFIDVQKNVRGMLKQFGMFGLKTEQITEFTAGYLETMQMQGRLENMTKRQQSLATVNYMKQLSELSKITGKSREEIAKGMQETNRNVNLNAQAASMSKEAGVTFLKNVNTIGGMMSGLGPEIQKGTEQMMYDMAKYQNYGLSEMGALFKTVPQLDKVMNELQSSITSGDTEGFTKAASRLRYEMANLSEKSFKQLNSHIDVTSWSDLAAAIVSVQMELNKTPVSITDFMSSMGVYTEKQLAEIAKNEKQFAKGTEALMKLQNFTNEVTGKVMSAFLNMFNNPEFAKSMNNFIDKINGWFSDDKINAAMEKFSEVITRMTDKLGDDVLVNALGKIMGWFESFATFLLSDTGSSLTNGMGLLGSVVSGIVSTLGWLNDKLGPLTTAILAFGGLFSMKVLGTIITSKIANWAFKSTASVGSSLMGTATTKTAAKASTGVLGRVASIGGKALGAAGSVLMMGKDVYDVGSSIANDEKVQNEDIGGIVGGVIGGAVGLLGGPVGVALGVGLGNMAGEWIGGMFDDAEVDTSAKIKAEAKGMHTEVIEPVRSTTSDPILALLSDISTNSKFLTNIDSSLKTTNLNISKLAKASINDRGIKTSATNSSSEVKVEPLEISTIEGLNPDDVAAIRALLEEHTDILHTIAGSNVNAAENISKIRKNNNNGTGILS